MHAAQYIFSGFGVKRFRKIAFQPVLFERTTLKGLYEESPVVAKVRKLHQKTTGQPAFRETYGLRRSDSMAFSSWDIHRIRVGAGRVVEQSATKLYLLNGLKSYVEVSHA